MTTQVDGGTAKKFAARGDWLTCTNGHFIARFKCDVYSGEPFDPAAIGDWCQEEPVIGSRPEPCDLCGKPWWLPDCHFHFNDGWRPPLPPIDESRTGRPSIIARLMARLDRIRDLFKTGY